MATPRHESMSTLNYLKRVFQTEGGSGGGSGGALRMRINVTGDTITVTSGGSYPTLLVDKKIEVWATGGAGVLLDEGNGYEFNPATGALSAMSNGDYLILIFE